MRMLVANGVFSSTCRMTESVSPESDPVLPQVERTALIPPPTAGSGSGKTPVGERKWRFMKRAMPGLGGEAASASLASSDANEFLRVSSSGGGGDLGWCIRRRGLALNVRITYVA